MKNKISLPVLPSKKSDKCIRIVKEGESKNCLAMWMGEIEAMIDLQPQENGNNSDVEVFAGDEEEDGAESSDEETAAAEDVWPNAIHWSNTLREITVNFASSRLSADKNNNLRPLFGNIHMVKRKC